MENFNEQEFFFLIALGMGIMSMLGIAVVFVYSQAKRKLLLEALKSKQNLLKNTILAQENERRRIAKDLHDEVGANLNIIHLQTQQLKSKTKENKLVQTSVSEMKKMVDNAINATRRISHDLLPPVLEEFGLEEALREMAENYNKTAALDIQLRVTAGQFPITTPLIELNLFRILQELISNSIKHGKAAHIEITLNVDQDRIEVHYNDDGLGCKLLSLESVRGLGMKNIESRLQIIKGEWSFKSVVNNGFQAKLIINTGE